MAWLIGFPRSSG